MAQPFSGSLRSLRQDSSRASTIGIALAALLLASWSGWALFARVGVYEVSVEARIEVVGASAVESPVSGPIDASALSLGAWVSAGDVLVSVDLEPHRYALAEQKSKQAEIESRLAGARTLVASNRLSLKHATEAARLALIEAELDLERQRAATATYRQDYRRLQRLSENRIVSEVDLAHAASELRERERLVEQAEIAVGRLRAQLDAQRGDREAELEFNVGLARELEAQLETVAAKIRTLEHEVSRRRVRAPLAGRLGEVADIRPGSYVAQGMRLCTIVPQAAATIVAHVPVRSLGKVRTEQPARFRLDGYPSPQFGSVQAHVTEVASETRDGRIRVELAVDDVPSVIPLEHGLPGRVEIEVERVRPLTLLLRFAGRLVDGSRVEPRKG